MIRIACLAALTTACASAPPPGSPSATTTSTQVAKKNWTGTKAPAFPQDRRLNVGFLVVDGVYNTELTAPYDIFQHTIFHTKPHPGMEVFTVSPDGKPVKTFEGLTISAHYSFANVPAIDVLVVPSAEHSMDTDLENEVMMKWVEATGKKALFVMSLCDGAFVLAKAGLVDERASTTFPGDVERYAKMFPKLDVRRNVSFVHDGPAITSQGGARSFDPAMYLVEHLWGEKIAKKVGRGMVIPWPPAPGAMPAVVVPRER